jgi:hypothetical protein
MWRSGPAGDRARFVWCDPRSTNVPFRDFVDTVYQDIVDTC